MCECERVQSSSLGQSLHLREQLPPELPETVARLRSVCDLPIAVGFGISRPEQKNVEGYAERAKQRKGS